MRLFPSARNRAAFLLLLAALLGCQPSGDAARATPDAASSAAEAAASPSAASPAADAAADIPDTPDAAAGAAPLSPRRAQWLADDVSRHLVIVHHVDPHAAPARVVADAFVLVPGDEGAPMDAAEKLVGDTAAALLRGPFAHRPDRATTVWVFAALAPYRAALRARIPDVPPSDYGVYDAASRQIFVCAATATILTAAPGSG